MATARIHLDVVDIDNAPLLIAPGSHCDQVAEQDIPHAITRHGIETCLADVADVWIYATPILHASKPAARPRRRRVLQVDYATRPLDGELEWLGI